MPQSGWQVPTNDGLWNPQTGTAFATTQDRAEAVRQLKAYIETHSEQFSDFEHKGSQELADKEVSHQYRPEANVGVRSVGRGFWYLVSGPFPVGLDEGLSNHNDNVGARFI